MRILMLVVVALAIGIGQVCAQEASPAATDGALAPAKKLKLAPAKVDPKEAAAITSYGIGMNTGRSIKADGVDIDLEKFIQGIRDGVKGAEPKYTTEQISSAMEIFKRDMQTKEEDRQKTVGEKNRREGQAFLAKNKAKAGVKTLPSGLQYEVLKAGKGATPKASDTVKVHYEGTLLDGTVFDSSIKRKEPAVFPVNRVIRGWIEALQLMKVGDRWRLAVPSDLAYGDQGAGHDIGPNAVLIFEVELLGIEPAGAKDAAPEEAR